MLMIPRKFPIVFLAGLAAFVLLICIAAPIGCQHEPKDDGGEAAEENVTQQDNSGGSGDTTDSTTGPSSGGGGAGQDNPSGGPGNTRDTTNGSEPSNDGGGGQGGPSGGGSTPDTTAPLISNVVADEITENSARITWTTDKPATSLVEYGPTSSYGSVSLLYTNMVTSHSVVLKGLTSGTTYHFRARAAAGDVIGYGADMTFTTTAVPSLVTTIAASSITYNSATLEGRLDSLGTATSVQVGFDWGTTTSYSNGTHSQTMSSTGAFSAQITGLAPSTAYHFRAKAVGNGTAHGADQTFTTSESVAPPVPSLTSPYVNAKYVPTQPRLVCNEVIDPEGDAVTYQFSLDDISDFSSPLISSMSRPTNVLKVGADWQGSLASGVTYYWRARACDASGALSAWSSTSSFTVDSSTYYFDDVSVGVRNMGVTGGAFANATETRNAVYYAFGDIDKVFGTTNNLKCWFEVSEIYSFSRSGNEEFYGYFNGNPHDLVVLYSDDASAGGYFGVPCVAINTPNCTGIANINYTDCVVHEIGHYRGAPDLYILEVPGAQNAVMSGVGHMPSTNDQEIMDYPYGVHVFGSYSKAMINASGADTRITWDPRTLNSPSLNYIRITDNSGNPILGAQVSVYANTPYRNLDGSWAFASCIDNSVDRQGQTDDSGKFLFAQKDNGVLNLAFDLLFVTVTYNGVTEYAWIEDIDAGGFYFGFKTSPIEIKDGTTFDIYYTNS